MGRQLPPLNALRAFDVAANAANFTEAAKQLNVSQGAVSRHIAQLEEFLGTTLFLRSRRDVRLTAEGADYALLIRGAFDRIEQATRLQRSCRQNRPLRVKLFPTVAIKWLVSRLGRFHTLHPAIDVQITTTSTLVSLDTDDVDFTIQIPSPPKDGVQYEPLFAIELIPVCSPAYLATIPALREPSQLLKCTLLHSMKRPDDWRTWFKGAAVKPSALHEGLTFGNSSLAYQAAIDGAGIAMAHTALVRDDLASGRLVVGYPLVVQTGQNYHLASRQTRSPSADVEAFRTWILAEVKADTARP